MRVIPSTVRDGHPDYALLSRIANAINERAGGADALRLAFPELMREARHVGVVVELGPEGTGRR